MMMRPLRFLGMMLASIALLPRTAPAQEVPPPDITGFVQGGIHARVGGELERDRALGSISMLPPADVESGFFLSKARLYFRGGVDERFGYTIQTDLAGGPSILTAYATARLSEGLRIQAGQMLKPFGRDRQRARHRLLSLDRSMGSFALVSRLLYGGWDLGAMVSAGSAATRLRTGLFNGRAPGVTADDDEGKNAVARLDLSPGEGLEAGVNVSYLHLSTLAPDRRGNLAWGADFLLDTGPLTLEGELLSADDHDAPPGTTGGPPRMLDILLTAAVEGPDLAGMGGTRLVLRVERLDPDISTDDDHMIMVLPSVDAATSASTRLQFGVVRQEPAGTGREAGTAVILLWQVNYF
ncbi:MAG: porin [bacterium]